MEGWPNMWRNTGYCANLALLELFPVVVVVEIWGDRLRIMRVHFLCDNMGVVQAVNRQTANSTPVIHLLQHVY